MWLAYRMLDKNIAGIEPNFFVASRVGQHDRVLVVSRSDYGKKRLQYMGVDSPAFAITPSVFVLLVNEWYFINASAPVLLAHRAGFPYPLNTQAQLGGRLTGVMADGTSKVRLPLLQPEPMEHVVGLYQPVFRGACMEAPLACYDTEWVRAHSLTSDSGLGTILRVVGRSLDELHIQNAAVLHCDREWNDRELMCRSAILSSQWQRHVTGRSPRLDGLPDGVRKRALRMFATCNRFNKAIEAAFFEELAEGRSRGK